MKRIRRKSMGLIALGVLSLWATGGAHAQGEADKGSVNETDAVTDAVTDTVPDASLHPPHLLDSPPPRFPPGRTGSGLHPTVILLVTVTPEAKVTDVVVEHSAGADFDAAAVEAVQVWTFEPAKRGETRVPSRIRVAVHFEEPDVGVHDHTGAYAGPASAADTDTDTGTGTGTEYRTDALVDAERLRSAGRGPADFEIDRDILNAAPVFSANDLLKRVPGLYASKPEGGAVGERFFLRGFDSEHGQDIEFKIGGIPINQPSHIHGQGYTYQGFTIHTAFGVYLGCEVCDQATDQNGCG